MQELSSQAVYGKEKLKEFQKKVTPYVNDFVKDFENTAKKTTNISHLLKINKIATDYIMFGGKLFRPSLAYYSFKLLGGREEKEVLKLGSIIENIHNYILIIDDFMDLSDKRHGNPTTHMMAQDYLKKNKIIPSDLKHAADSLAVSLGIAVSHGILKEFGNLKTSKKILLSLINTFNENIQITAYGQILDILNSMNKKVTEKEVFKMLELKTGVYTYKNPIHCGAILAGCTDERIFNMLTEFAIPAGIAFQIWDDVLGVFGDSDVSGKSILDDLKEGKYTLLIHYALANGTKEQKRIIKEHLGNKKLNVSQHKLVKKALIDSGSYAYSKMMAEKYVKKAQTTLIKNKQKNWNEDAFNYLIGISSYTVERDN